MNNSIYPSWHFIGSKLSMLPWVTGHINELSFFTMLDLFGGSGIISHELRLRQKSVYYNDFLKHLQVSANGLLNCSYHDKISKELVSSILNNNENLIIHDLILKYFKNYFFESECEFILRIYTNIKLSKANSIQESLLLFALFQSMLKKRPFHTFHGSFLNMRLKDRQQSQTWDRALQEIFQGCIQEINAFLEFLPSNLPKVAISGFNASEIKPELFTNEQIDLIYLDPPFISNKKKRTLKFANYTKNYQALELLIQQKDISSFFDSQTNELLYEKFLPTKEMNLWLDQNQKKWLESFEKIITNFEESQIVISYRSDSLISKENILEILKSHKKKISFFQTHHLYERMSKTSKFDDYLFICQ